MHCFDRKCVWRFAGIVSKYKPVWDAGTTVLSCVGRNLSVSLRLYAGPLYFVSALTWVCCTSPACCFCVRTNLSVLYESCMRFLLPTMLPSMTSSWSSRRSNSRWNLRIISVWMSSNTAFLLSQSLTSLRIFLLIWKWKSRMKYVQRKDTSIQCFALRMRINTVAFRQSKSHQESSPKQPTCHREWITRVLSKRKKNFERILLPLSNEWSVTLV